MAASASVALASARTYLGDPRGINWTDPKLFPHVQEAHRELILRLRSHSINAILDVTAPITVLANTTDLTTGGLQPESLISPINIKERDPVSGVEFMPMQHVRFLANYRPDTLLHYWTWQQEHIKFIGATTDRQILLSYKKNITAPVLQTDSLGFTMGELYVGPRAAGLALDSIGRDGTKHNDRAEFNLNEIIRACVTEDQRPVRRRRYRSGKNFLPGNYTNISTGGGSPYVPQWILPNNLPNGADTVFYFSRMPIRVSYNGLNQFLGAGYQLDLTGGTIKVTLVDFLGVIITPAIGDDVRAEVL